MADDSLSFFLRLVRERHEKLTADSKVLIRMIAGDDSGKKKSAAGTALQSATDLRAVLSQGDIPSWLSESISFFSSYQSGNCSNADLLLGFFPLHERMRAHKWVFDRSTNTAFDFDSIFEHFKKEGRLPELFDQIVKILEDIQNSGEVDSVAMLRALHKLISTLKKCKDGSYFSLNTAWEFLLSFLNNYLWGELAKLPVLGTAMEALEKTIKEANDEMFALHKKLHQEVTQMVETDVKVLKDKAAFPFITYDRNGHSLPGPSVQRITDTKA